MKIRKQAKERRMQPLIFRFEIAHSIFSSISGEGHPNLFPNRWTEKIIILRHAITQIIENSASKIGTHQARKLRITTATRQIAIRQPTSIAFSRKKSPAHLFGCFTLWMRASSPRRPGVIIPSAIQIIQAWFLVVLPVTWCHQGEPFAYAVQWTAALKKAAASIHCRLQFTITLITFSGETKYVKRARNVIVKKYMTQNRCQLHSFFPV